MKSTKYKKHYRSKYKYPTRIVSNGGKDGTLIIGHRAARKDLEKQLGRPLKDGTKVTTRGWNWCFSEPIGEACSK